MNRKSFAGELGWGMVVAHSCVLTLLASQVYLEAVGDEAADTTTWAVLAFLAAAVVVVDVLTYLKVRQYNAMVDLRERWQRHAPENDNVEFTSDPGSYWHH